MKGESNKNPVLWGTLDNKVEENPIKVVLISNFKNKLKENPIKVVHAYCIRTMTIMFNVFFLEHKNDYK